VVLSFYASSRNKAKKIVLLKKKLSILINSFQTALEYIEAAEARAKTPEALPQLPDYMDYE
jgi:hypothetical protein